MQKRGQASVEYLAIIGIVLVVTIPLFFYSFQKSSENIKINQADDAVNTVARAADSVYALGPGAKRFVWVTIPQGTTGSSINNNSVQLQITIFGGISDIHASSRANLIGVMPYEAGVYKIPVESLDSGYVQIGSGNDTEPPIVVFTTPSGIICNQYVTLKANTNEPAFCKYDITDTDYDAMSITMVGNALTHEKILGLQPEGTYNYYIRCKDPSNNTMTSSALLTFSINFTQCGQGIGNGTGVGCTAGDTNLPLVTLDSPPNNTVDADGIIFFKFNVSDESDIAYCQLVLNDDIYQLISPPIYRNQTNNLIVGGIDYGNYTWNINCTDGCGLRGPSDERIFHNNYIQDYGIPIVTLKSPPDNYVRNFWLVKFIYNTSDVDSGIAHCYLHLQGTLILNNTILLDIKDSPVQENIDEEITIPLFKGNYTWNVSCTDSSYFANEGWSSTRKLIINVTAGESAFLDSCGGACGNMGYIDGQCVQNCGGSCSGTCQSSGDQYCTIGPPTPNCCCYS